MGSFRTWFKRIEAWLFHKPYLYGIGCFVACLLIGAVLTVAGHAGAGHEWILGSPLLGFANWLYALFYQWRQGPRS